MINHRHSISIVLFFIGLYASAFQYTVSGDVHTTELDGQKAYLMLNDINQLIDSAEITDGRFTMSGTAPREGLVGRHLSLYMRNTEGMNALKSLEWLRGMILPAH